MTTISIDLQYKSFTGIILKGLSKLNSYSWLVNMRVIYYDLKMLTLNINSLHIRSIVILWTYDILLYFLTHRVMIHQPNTWSIVIYVNDNSFNKHIKREEHFLRKQFWDTFHSPQDDNPYTQLLHFHLHAIPIIQIHYEYKQFV